MATVDEILKKIQEQQDAAKTANEGRYQDILKLYEGQGTQAKADIAKAGGETKAGTTQSLISRGLGNTSVLDAMNQNTDALTSANQARVGESVAMNKAGVMERRTDAYPDMGLYVGLLNSLGKSQGQQGPTGQLGGGYGGRGGGGGAGGGGSSTGSSFLKAAYSGGGGGGSAQEPAGGGGGPGGGSYSAIAGRGTGTTLTGSDAVRFGGAGATRVSIPPVVGGGGSAVGFGEGYSGFVGPPEPVGEGYRNFVGPPSPTSENTAPDANPQATDTNYPERPETSAEPAKSSGGITNSDMVSVTTGTDKQGYYTWMKVPRSSATWSPDQQRWYVKKGNTR